MRKYILQLAFLSALFLLILILQDFFISVKKIPSLRWQAKHHAVNLDSMNSYNTFFIGASTVNKQIDPRIIDSITGLKSLNLGLDGQIASPKISYLKLLIEKKIIQNGANVIVECNISSPPSLIKLQDKFLGPQANFLYLYTTNNFLDDLNLLYAISDINIDQIEPLARLIKLYTLSRFKLSLAESYNLHILSTQNSLDLLLDEKLTNMEKEAYLTNIKVSLGYFPYFKNHKDSTFEEHFDYYKMVLSTYLEYWQNDQFNQEVKDAFLRPYYSLDLYCQKKGINVIYIIPPRIGLKFRELPILRSSTTTGLKIINISNSTKYPEFNDSKLFYNISHLNSYGAKIYSHKIGIELKQFTSN